MGAAAERHVPPLCTSQLATVFIFMLPFMLATQIGLLAVPCVATIGWAFFGFQEIGHIIEEPFGKTKRLRALADSVGYSRLYGRLNDSNETPPRVGSAGSLAASEALQKRKRAIQRMQASEAAREAGMFEAAVQAGLFIHT